MATTMMKKMVIFVGLLLGVCSTVGADTDSPNNCKIDFLYTEHMELCHKPNLKTADQCKRAGWGFVLDELVIAPLTEYHDCGSFHNNDLYDANCLREKIVKYDERVFEVLEKVSGQNKIDNGTTVERFEFSVAGADTEGGGSAEKDSSAFVSFNRQCRPADPDKSDPADTMVNMCANMTVDGFRVYLTLQGTADVPSQASFCRCVITPNAEMHVKALDVRLQNVKDDDQGCGPSVLKIDSKEPPDSGSRDLKCEGKKALYGFHELHKGSKDKEVVLTLSSVDSNHFPTAVWIEVEQEFDPDPAHSLMTVACEGFVSMSELVVPVTTTEPGDGPQDEGVPLGLIIGAAVVGLLLIAIIIIIIILVKRRGNGSGGCVLPLACRDCCKRDSKGKKPYKQVMQNEPIYSEPGNPRPAPYTDPVDAKLPVGRAEYAEPDPSGRSTHVTTPPPLPTSPPPTSPPPGVTPTGTSFPFPTQPQDAVPSVAFSTDEEAPPKPMRTFERAKKRSKKSEAEEEEEEYDHIVSKDKPSLKSLRNGQNNNVIAKNEEEKEPNLYSHLVSHGENLTLKEMKAKLKPVVKDSVYNTTS